MMSSSGPPPIAWAFGDSNQKRRWRRYWIEDVILGLGQVALHYSMQPLPITWCSHVGALLGAAIGPLDRAADGRVRRQLQCLRPELSDGERENIRQRMWANVGRTMAEFSVLPRLWRSDRVIVYGLDQLGAARAFDRPRIYAAVHLGNWELLGPKLLALGEDGVEFFDPPRNRFQRRLAERTRYYFSDRLIPPGLGSVLKARRLLRTGRGLVMFVDEFTDGQVRAPLLGRSPMRGSSLGAIARLALAEDATVVPAYVVRREDVGFDLHILPPMRLQDTEIAEAACRINDVLEPIVREHLEQWYMLHELRDF